jgi:hypothetical protein
MYFFLSDIIWSFHYNFLSKVRLSIEMSSTKGKELEPRNSFGLVSFFLFENKMHFVFWGEKMKPDLKHHLQKSFKHFWRIPVITEICVPRIYMWVSSAKMIDLTGFLMILGRL